MRHLVLDTETTGLSEKDGHRIIEIGAVEMVNLSCTGRSLHLYINPERDIDVGAQDIHGLSSEFLADKPVFADILTEFTDFIGDDLLVIHNAPFDIGFLNAEFSRCDHPPLSMERVIDTLPLARERYQVRKRTWTRCADDLMLITPIVNYTALWLMQIFWLLFLWN